MTSAARTHSKKNLDPWYLFRTFVKESGFSITNDDETIRLFDVLFYPTYNYNKYDYSDKLRYTPKTATTYTKAKRAFIENHKNGAGTLKEKVNDIAGTAGLNGTKERIRRDFSVRVPIEPKSFVDLLYWYYEKQDAFSTTRINAMGGDEALSQQWVKQ